MEGPLLTIEELPEGLRLLGEVDLSTIEEFQRALGDAVTPGRALVLDLSGCTYMGSESIGVLIAAWKELGTDGSLELRVPPGPLRNVLEIAGLAKFPNVHISGGEVA